MVQVQDENLAARFNKLTQQGEEDRHDADQYMYHMTEARYYARKLRLRGYKIESRKV